MATPTAALQELAERAALRKEELAKYDDEPTESEGESDAEFECPIVEKFYEENGNQAIMDMTNFNRNEFETIYKHLEDHIGLKYNKGRGQKSSIKAKDLLFMTMAVLKHGANWDLMAYLFGFKAPTFEKRVTGMVSIVSGFAYDRFVTQSNKRFTMQKLVHDKTVFKNYPMCRYATDVTFQQSYRPGGSLQESKRYFSGKHKLYGFKVEVSVLPNGQAVSTSQHEPGSVSDIAIMRSMLHFHDDALEKTEEEKAFVDISERSAQYPNAWAVLVDKGYTGIEAEVRAVIPKKKPKGGILTLADRKENEAKSSDRVLVENYFGRQGTLWTVISSKYRWAEENYDSIFGLTVALTNVHIRWHPLRDADGKMFERYCKKLSDIAETAVKKRKRAQAAYRKKRKRSMERNVRVEHQEGAAAMLFDDETGSDSI